jgi:polysaccharide pyruvyl transferase WcaK-like protein
MRIAHYGTFDVKNYGDSLFPILVRNQLANLAASFIHVSPVGGQAYRDVPASVSVTEFHRMALTVDAVIVGGGNIIHSRRTPLAEYRQVNRTAYPNLWVDAAKVAAEQHVPLIFNAPGVPQRPGVLTRKFMRSAFDSASYVSVRDQRSYEMLSDLNLTVEVRVVPDTALLLSQAIEIEPHSGHRYIAVHLNERYIASVEEMAANLDSIATRLEASVVLIAIGACHGDGELALDVAEKMVVKPTVLSDPSTVREIANTIANSVLYLGSSLHGFITACSYGVPAAIVAKNDIQHKFLGLLEELDAQDRLIPSWQLAVTRCLDSGGLTHLMQPLDVNPAKSKVREHWAEIGEVLAKKRQADSYLSRLPQPGRAVAVANVIEQAAYRGSAKMTRNRRSASTHIHS